MNRIDLGPPQVSSPRRLNYPAVVIVNRLATAADLRPRNGATTKKTTQHLSIVATQPWICSGMEQSMEQSVAKPDPIQNQAFESNRNFPASSHNFTVAPLDAGSGSAYDKNKRLQRAWPRLNRSVGGHI